jgi:Amt family ammonium transporter
VYTHGIAGLLGGLLVGVLADPNMIVYFGPKGTATGAFGGAGAIWGHHPKQVLIQLLAGLTIIVWDAIVTAAILYFIKFVLRMKLRLPDEVLEVGDVAIHGEEAFPDSPFMSRVAEAESSPSTEQPPVKASASAED